MREIASVVNIRGQFLPFKPARRLADFFLGFSFSAALASGFDGFGSRSLGRSSDSGEFKSKVFHLRGLLSALNDIPTIMDI